MHKHFKSLQLADFLNSLQCFETEPDVPSFLTIQSSISRNLSCIYCRNYFILNHNYFIELLNKLTCSSWSQRVTTVRTRSSNSLTCWKKENIHFLMIRTYFILIRKEYLNLKLLKFIVKTNCKMLSLWVIMFLNFRKPFANIFYLKTNFRIRIRVSF